MRISRWRKDRQSLTQHITVDKVNDDKGENLTPNPKSSMFDMLQPPRSQQHASMFSRMEKDKTPKSYVFYRLKEINILSCTS